MYQKRKISFMLVIILVFQIVFPVLTVLMESEMMLKSIGYEGTEYFINTAQDLWDFAEIVNNGNTFKDVTVYLTEDIDLECSEENQWVPIDTFEGIFEGNGHFIKGLYIKEENEISRGYIGLFGKNKGIITNLTIKDSNITIDTIETGDSLDLRIGTITASNYGDIINCINSVDISVKDGEDKFIYLGGIVGENKEGRIIGCTNFGKIETVGYNAGGIVGYSDGGKVNDCKNFSTIKSTYTKNSVGSMFGVGGIVGVCSERNNAEIVNNLNQANIEGKNSIGGIIGSVDIQNNYYNKKIIIKNNYNKGNVKGYQCVGGIIGKYDDFNKNEEENIIYACYNEGEIINCAYAGGIIGEAEMSTTTIKECYNIGNITGGSHHVGGIVGTISGDGNDNLIINCYNRGDIEWNHGSAGGLIGSNVVQVMNCYTTGNIINTDSSTAKHLSVRISCWHTSYF